MTNVGKWVRGALVIAALLEVAAIAGTIAYRRQWRAAAIEAGAPLPALRGYQLDVAGGPYSAPAGCVIYRFVSHLCGYCLQAEPSWKRLMEGSAARRCHLAVVLPNLKAAPYYLKKTVVPVPQIVWMPLGWARAVHFEVTPTTLVVYRGRIVWVHEGEMGTRGFADLRALVARMPGG